MFKSRIKQWKLNKNYKAAERISIAQILRHHKMKGCTSPQVLLYGRPVKMHRVQRHCKGGVYFPQPALNDYASSLVEDNKRYQVRCTCCTGDICQDQGSQAHVTTLKDIHNRYSLSPKPQLHLALPTGLKNVELILEQTSVFYRSYCEGQTSKDLSPNIDRPPTEVQYILELNPNIFFHMIAAGASALRSGQQTAGWRLIHKASDITMPLLMQQHPYTLKTLLHLASQLETDDKPDLFRSIWSFIGEMASTTLGPTHPISLTCKALLATEEKSLVHARAAKLILTILEQNFGRYDVRALDARAGYIASLRILGLEAEQERLTTDLLHDFVCLGYDVAIANILIDPTSINVRMIEVGL